MDDLGAFESGEDDIFFVIYVSKSLWTQHRANLCKGGHNNWQKEVDLPLKAEWKRDLNGSALVTV